MCKSSKIIGPFGLRSYGPRWSQSEGVDVMAEIEKAERALSGDREAINAVNEKLDKLISDMVDELGEEAVAKMFRALPKGSPLMLHHIYAYRLPSKLNL